MKREITRAIANEYCTVTIEIKDGRLSVCGEAGYVTTPPKARKEALEYWRSFFENNPKEILDMNARCDTNYRAALSAAKYVLRSDGEYHGLDAKERDGKVYICHSRGQIREDIARFFPEVVPLFAWHLNDMRAGCSHQKALGWDNSQCNIPCPKCGYCYGTKWLREELPLEIVTLAETVCT